MKGFDPTFRDFPSYIIDITRQIWEDRDLASLHRYYDENIIMRSPSGVVLGNQSVITDTLATLSESPDKELLAEDVIWYGDDDRGYFSSHRLVTFGTHSGNGAFGPPTGKKYCVRAIADCAAIENKIYDEWVIRDNSGIAVQLGLDVQEIGRAQIRSAPQASAPFSPDIDVEGRYLLSGNKTEWGDRAKNVLSNIMAGKVCSIRADYDRCVEVIHPGLRHGWSWAFAETQWMRLRSSFPDAVFKIEHVVGLEEKMMGPRAAIRWSLHGKHSGFGLFGAPSNAEVYVMGFTHMEFGPWGIRREFTIFDDIAIWNQILRHTGHF